MFSRFGSEVYFRDAWESGWETKKHQQPRQFFNPKSQFPMLIFVFLKYVPRARFGVFLSISVHFDDIGVLSPITFMTIY